jgi:hypothetical protein
MKDFTTIQPVSPFDKHVLTCIGIETSLTFNFNTNSEGKTFYLIDVSSLSSAPYNMTALSKEVSGGNCLSGMKLKIQIRGAPTTASATTTTITTLINSKTVKAAMSTGQISTLTTTTKSGAVSQLHISAVFSLLLIAGWSLL